MIKNISIKNFKSLENVDLDREYHVKSLLI